MTKDALIPISESSQVFECKEKERALLLQESPQRHSLINGLLAILTISFLWFILINELRIEWTINPQYSFGAIVPLLCVGLTLRRWKSLMESQNPPPSLTFGRLLSHFKYVIPFLFVGSALILLPLRLILEANPGWRTLNIVLAISVTFLTVIIVYQYRGLHWMRQLVFPICFILVAVPWPHSIEMRLIQELTRANVAVTIELLSWLGIPASQHGNLIEISTGVVGVNEACSGIRSFQSSIMISLFFGELYRFGVRWRILLLPIGFLIAFAFNVCRTSILTWISAQKGVEAIAQYHDRTGFSITIACSLVLWAFSWFLSNQQKSALNPLSNATGTVVNNFSPPFFSFRAISCLLLSWLLFVEIGVEMWYRSHESKLKNRTEWTLQWPPEEDGFKEHPVPEVAREMLKYDEGHAGTWSSGAGYWYLYYFRWLPGRMALASARSHSPEVCLPAAGKELRKLDQFHSPIVVHSIAFPFSRYEYEETGKMVYVFHCIWEDHAPGQYFTYDSGSSETLRRLRAVGKGQRNLGQRSIEIIVSGIEDAKAARTEVTRQLEKLIVASKD